MWQPDGWDVNVRIGVLTPHADVGPESEMRAMAPPHVGIHAARVPFGAMGAGGAMDPTVPVAPVRAFVDPPHLDEAAERLAAAPLHAIAFGFTSSAFVIGADGEKAMIDRLAQRTHGIPVVATGAASVEALRLLGVQRLSLVLPPWFDAELNALGSAYYQAAGFDVVAAAVCELPSDQRAITPDGLYAWVVEHSPDSADAVVIGGNGFRAVGVIAALEETTDRPVLTANQVLFWAALRAASANGSGVTGYGRLFAVA
jgi:maleate isomerase